MSETLDMQPNVESLSQGKWWSGRVELAEIQSELNKVASSAPNPSKAPLNYIDNLDEWEKSQKEYNKEVREKQQELAIVLQISEDKLEEISDFRKEKAQVDIEIQKTKAPDNIFFLLLFENLSPPFAKINILLFCRWLFNNCSWFPILLNILSLFSIACILYFILYIIKVNIFEIEMRYNGGKKEEK